MNACQRRWVRAGAGAFAAGAFAALALAASAAEKKPPQDFYFLLELLETGDVQERRDIARSLGVMGFEVATPALIEALDDSDPKVRLLAAESLGKIGDERGVDPLLAKLPFAEDGVKRFILGSLGKIGDSRALDALVEALQNESVAEVRSSAAFGLGELGDATATEALVAALDDENEWVRLEVCGALRKLKAVSAIDRLELVAENDENDQVRRAAKKAWEVIRE